MLCVFGVLFFNVPRLIDVNLCLSLQFSLVYIYRSSSDTEFDNFARIVHWKLEWGLRVEIVFSDLPPIPLMNLYFFWRILFSLILW